jgi:hypothetical protein
MRKQLKKSNNKSKKKSKNKSKKKSSNKSYSPGGAQVITSDQTSANSSISGCHCHNHAEF